MDIKMDGPENGLVWGYAFSDDGSARALNAEAALKAVNARESWVWLHFDLGDQRAQAALAALNCIPREAMDVLTGTDERPWLDAISDSSGSSIVGVALDFEREDEPDPRKMVAWRFFMQPHVFISTRRRPLLTIQKVHFDLMGGRRFNGVLKLFDGIMHAYITALSAISRDLTERLDVVEDGLLEGRNSGDFEELGLVRRGATRLNRQTLPINAMLAHLLGERPDWFPASAAEDFENIQHRASSLAADLTSLQERARALQDEVNSRQAEETNRRLTLLSVFSAVLLPPTLISGVFGMNVDGLPWKEGEMGFTYTMLLMAGSIVLRLASLRRMKLL